MFDIDIKDERNFTLHLIVLIIYLIVVIANHKKLLLQVNGKKSNFNYRSIFFWTLLICVFHFVDGDYYTTMRSVHEYRVGDETYAMEPFYYWLIKITDNNYFIFRFVVWGMAIIAYHFTAKLFQLPAWFAIYILFFTNINTFAYARFTLASSIYFLGVALVLNSFIHAKVKRIVAGVLFIILSIVFHKSAFFLVAMSLMMLVPINKFVLYITAIAVPLIIPFMSSLFESILMGGGFLDNDLILTKLEGYTNRETDFGTGRIIMGASRFLFYYVEFLIFAFIIYWKNDPKELNGIDKLFKISAGLVVCSIFVFFMGKLMETLFYRILNMAMIPLTLIFCYLCYHKLLSKRTIYFLLLLGFISSMTKFMYASYLAYYLK